MNPKFGHSLDGSDCSRDSPHQPTLPISDGMCII
jgi:hypothetical protein